MKNMTKPVRGSTPQPDHIMISINGDPETEMTLTWRTSVDVAEGYAEYWEKDGEKLRCNALTEVFESDIDISNMFWAHLKDLKPDTQYFYTCGDCSHRSDTYSFKTAPENLTKFKFICISDQQQGEPHDCPDYSHFNKYLKGVLEQHPDARFILTGGDNTDCGQHEVQWNGAFSGFVGISEHIPVMMTLGNHDNRGFEDYKNHIGRYYSEPAEFFSKQFKHSYPYNGPKGWKTENYSFDYGNAHFNVIGVNAPETVNEWLKSDIDRSDKQWKLGAYHFPICYSGAEAQNFDAYPYTREGMEKLDVLFAGHEHNFSRSFPVRNEEIFDRPSEGTVHYMLGNSGFNPPGAQLPKVWHSAFFAHQQRKAMVAVVEIDGGKMTLTSVLDDGRIVDKCVIDKDKDLILPHALAPVFKWTRMMYKGADLGLCQMEVPCENREGVWYACLAVLIGYAGGYVQKTPGEVFLEIYGHSMTAREGSGTIITDRGEKKLPGKVYRGHAGQLYIPVEAVTLAFDMRWSYVRRNNFILFEHMSEDKPITVQP